MTTLFILLVASLGYGTLPVESSNVDQIASVDNDISNRGIDSFSYSTDIELDEIVHETFHYPGQTYYYHYTLESSGYFIGLAADSHNILVSYYGSNDNGVTTTFLRSNLSCSTNPNFGYEYGNYFDKDDFSDIYISVADRYYSSSSLSFYFTFTQFEKRDTTDFQLLKYDVASGFYSFITHQYTYYGGPITSGFNPNGSPTVSIPSYSAGTDFPLTLQNGYDTTSEFPYTSIGHIHFKAGLTHYWGTGFLIGSKYFATAAHIIIDEDHVYDELSSASIFFGRSQENSYAEIGYFKTVYFVADYHDDNTGYNYTVAQYDWAVCELDDNYGSTLGYLRIMNGNQLNYTSSKILCHVGYKGGNAQIACYGSFVIKYDDLIYSTANTGSGSSGGPIIDVTSGYVIGIHSHSGYEAGVNCVGGNIFKPIWFSFLQGLIGGNIQ